MRSRVGGFVGAVLTVLALALLLVVVNGNDADDGAIAHATPVPAEKQELAIAVSDAATARVGAPFDLQPDIANPRHAALMFTAENLPPWARIDSSTGRISGTPRTSDMGEHSDIVIMVADGAQRATTAPFSIKVVASGMAVATLEWRRPDSRVDGSPLDDLAGYRISYGRDPDDLDHSVFIADPDETTYEFYTLEEGMWYFTVIGVNANGVEGPPTVTAQKAI